VFLEDSRFSFTIFLKKIWGPKIKIFDTFNIFENIVISVKAPKVSSRALAGSIVTTE